MKSRCPASSASASSAVLHGNHVGFVPVIKPPADAAKKEEGSASKKDKDGNPVFEKPKIEMDTEIENRK